MLTEASASEILAAPDTQIVDVLANCLSARVATQDASEMLWSLITHAFGEFGFLLEAPTTSGCFKTSGLTGISDMHGFLWDPNSRNNLILALALRTGATTRDSKGWELRLGVSPGEVLPPYKNRQGQLVASTLLNTAWPNSAEPRDLFVQQWGLFGARRPREANAVFDVPSFVRNLAKLLTDELSF